jgi:predicted PurR-regulated permease PerM
MVPRLPQMVPLAYGRDANAVWTVSDAETQAQRVAAAAQREIVTFEVPAWLRTIGLSSWLALGIAAILALVLSILALVTEVAIPLAIAAVLAAILVPLTDRLEGWHVPRWLGATLVLVLALSVVAATIALVVSGIISQSDEIWARLQDGLQQMNADFGGTATGAAPLVNGAHSVVRVLTSGVLGGLVSSAGGFIISTVLALFMLLFLLKDWAQITGWTTGHLGVPESMGQTILDGTVGSFRGYASGLTLIGAANAAVVAVGALLLGLPLIGTIALVTFVTSYVPYLGAFVAGAFAVVIGYGSGGLGVALAMLAIVLLANNTIQNVIEPFAFGNRLRLHPFVILITVTSATVMFGVLGAVLAAPLTSAAVNTYHQLREVGVIGEQSDAAPLPDAGAATTDR